MKKKKTYYKGFLIDYGNFYDSGERWYTWSGGGEEIPFDRSRKGFGALKEAKAAIDEYKKAPQ